jgi:hypothetical protein
MCSLLCDTRRSIDPHGGTSASVHGVPREASPDREGSPRESNWRGGTQTSLILAVTAATDGSRFVVDAAGGPRIVILNVS